MLGQNTCGTMIKHIHDDLEKSANNAMRKNKITMTQCTALLIIDNRIDKQMTLKDLEYGLNRKDWSKVFQAQVISVLKCLE
mgnify:CR=1 FL=1